MEARTGVSDSAVAVGSRSRRRFGPAAGRQLDVSRCGYTRGDRRGSMIGALNILPNSNVIHAICIRRHAKPRDTHTRTHTLGQVLLRFLPRYDPTTPHMATLSIQDICDANSVPKAHRPTPVHSVRAVRGGCLATTAAGCGSGRPTSWPLPDRNHKACTASRLSRTAMGIQARPGQGLRSKSNFAGKDNGQVRSGCPSAAKGLVEPNGTLQKDFLPTVGA